MPYATTTELADYLGVDEADLPDDASRLLERASEFIDYITLNRIDDTETSQAEAARKAVCAQIEYWQELGGDELVLLSKVNEISIGEFSMRGGVANKSAEFSELASRARQYLFLEGLLNTGINMKSDSISDNTFS